MSKSASLVIVDGQAYLPTEETAKRLGIAVGTLRNQSSLPNGFIRPACHVGRQSLYALSDVERLAVLREARP